MQLLAEGKFTEERKQEGSYRQKTRPHINEKAKREFGVSYNLICINPKQKNNSRANCMVNLMSFLWGETVKNQSTQQLHSTDNFKQLFISGLILHISTYQKKTESWKASCDVIMSEYSADLMRNCETGMTLQHCSKCGQEDARHIPISIQPVIRSGGYSAAKC